MNIEIGTENKPKTVRRISNRRARWNRIVGNIFRFIFAQEQKLPDVEELSVDGIFARMQKDKERRMQIVAKQDEAIEMREVAAKKAIERSDMNVKRLMEQIEDAKKELQEKLAADEIDKAAIAAEKERVKRVSQRMSEFFA